MKSRQFGKDGVEISEVGLGCWQLGGDCWGNLDEDSAMEILSAAVDNGIRFFDTADVYGAGRSEKLIGRFLKNRPEDIFVATKLGRLDQDKWPMEFTEGLLRKYIEGSLKRLGVDALELTQLHCIAAEHLKKGEVFEWLRKFKRKGLIKRFGASVESMDEALLCLDQEELESLQIIFNIFRQKPLEELLTKAGERNVSLIARVPLASGLLTGKLSKDSDFAQNDHRSFNRDGQMFNVGETFAGLPYDKGVELADQLKPWVPEGMTYAQMALRWILDHEAISVAIPGASRPSQVAANAQVSTLPSLPIELHEQLRDFYQENVAEYIRGPY